MILSKVIEQVFLTFLVLIKHLLNRGLSTYAQSGVLRNQECVQLGVDLQSGTCTKFLKMCPNVFPRKKLGIYIFEPEQKVSCA